MRSLFTLVLIASLLGLAHANVARVRYVCFSYLNAFVHVGFLAFICYFFLQQGCYLFSRAWANKMLFASSRSKKCYLFLSFSFPFVCLFALLFFSCWFFPFVPCANYFVCVGAKTTIIEYVLPDTREYSYVYIYTVT